MGVLTSSLRQPLPSNRSIVGVGRDLQRSESSPVIEEKEQSSTSASVFSEIRVEGSLSFGGTRADFSKIPLSTAGWPG